MDLVRANSKASKALRSKTATFSFRIAKTIVCKSFERDERRFGALKLWPQPAYESFANKLFKSWRASISGGASISCAQVASRRSSPKSIIIIDDARRANKRRSKAVYSRAACRVYGARRREKRVAATCAPNREVAGAILRGASCFEIIREWRFFPFRMSAAAARWRLVVLCGAAAVALLLLPSGCATSVDEEDGGGSGLDDDADLLVAARIEQLRLPVLAASAFNRDEQRSSSPIEETIATFPAAAAAAAADGRRQVIETRRRKPPNPNIDTPPGR